METTATFTVNITGEDTGRTYSGKFLVKTILSRKDRFIADERRRVLIGANSQMAAPSVQGEALMFGELLVRIIEAPKFWVDADGGLDIEDANVIGEVFKLAIEKELEAKKAIKEDAEEAVKKLSKKVTTAAKSE